MAQDFFASSPELDLKKRWALLQLQGAADTSPVGHPLGAVARALQGAMGGYFAGQVEADDKAAGDAMFSGLPGVSPVAKVLAQPSGPSAGPSPAPARSTPDMSQPRGIRNNNPLNIEAGGFTQSQPGYSGSDGRFARFETPEAGVGAANKLLDIYQNKHGLNTVAGIVGRWAPSSDGNNVSAYASNVAKQLGVDPNAPIPPEMRPQLIAAMGQHENGRPISMPQQPYQVAGPAVAQTPVAQASGQQPGQPPQAAPSDAVPNRSQVQIPPEVAATIQQLGRDPRTRAQAWQLYLQYAKPVEQYQQGVDNNGVPFQRNTVTGEKKADPTREAAINEVEYARKNWQQLGFPDPSNADPKARNFWKEYNAKRLGGAGVNVSIDQSGPNEFEKDYSQGMSKRAIDVLNQGDAATQDLQQSALSRAFLSKVKTGTLAPAQATVGAWAKSIGMDPATLGIDPNLPAISQAAQSAVAQQTVGMIGAGGFPANNFSDADRKFLNSIPANISNTPEANELLADVREKIAQRKIDRANAWADAREQGQSYEKFEREWRRKVSKEDMFADIRGKVGGMSGGQITPPNVDDLVKKYGPK